MKFFSCFFRLFFPLAAVHRHGAADAWSRSARGGCTGRVEKREKSHDRDREMHQNRTIKEAAKQEPEMFYMMAPRLFSRAEFITGDSTKSSPSADEW